MELRTDLDCLRFHFQGKRIILWATPSTRGPLGTNRPQADDLSAVREVLTRLGCRVDVLTSEKQLHERMKTRPPDLVVARVCNKCEGALEKLVRPDEPRRRPPVVLLATSLDVPAYLEGMRRGAFDCVGLPLHEKEFIRILARALQVPAAAGEA